MLKDRLTLVILSCDKFSDLWDTHIMLLNQNWADREVDTFLVTDAEAENKYNKVKVISAGKGKELSERIESVLGYINTKYVLITLDDYFPIFKIETTKIEKLVEAMDKEHLDYIRLFKRPNSRKRICGYSSLFEVDFDSRKDSNYQVNLYAGIWRKSFVSKTIGKPLNAWQYEISLTKIAREVNAKCAMSKGREFEALDVVRKGQLLHKANRYLKRRNLYDGFRTVISWKAELKINLFTFLKSILPQNVITLGKKLMNRFGVHFYSNGC